MNKNNDEYEPEYVRLGREPIVAVSSVKDREEFNRNMRNMRRGKPSVQPKPKSAYAGGPRHTGRITIRDGSTYANEPEPQYTDSPTHNPPQIKKNFMSSGVKQSWYEPEGHDKHINQEEYEFDDVAADESEARKPTEFERYCIMLNGEMVFSSNSLEEVEGVIEDLLFEQKTCVAEDLNVFQRMNIKVGVSVR